MVSSPLFAAYIALLSAVCAADGAERFNEIKVREKLA
jgi:hypothetical protein